MILNELRIFDTEFLHNLVDFEIRTSFKKAVRRFGYFYSYRVGLAVMDEIYKKSSSFFIATSTILVFNDFI